nr:MAG TPA: hypothetical protein [Caudoviricetes sp.]
MSADCLSTGQTAPQGSPGTRQSSPPERQQAPETGHVARSPSC